jgi:membrane protein DedA with SNARE-associated domain
VVAGYLGSLGRMNLIVAVYAAMLGVFVGFFFASALGRWAYAIWTTVRARHVGGSEHKTRPLVWALPVVLVLHSTPWLLAIAGWASYYFLSRPHESWLHWFFGGVGASLILMVALGLLTWRRIRRSAAQRESVGHAA